MKRVAIPVETDSLCHYGCGCVAKFKNGSGNLMCKERSSSCPSIKQKNREKTKAAYSEGKRPSQKDLYKSLPDNVKDKMRWNTGNVSADFVYNGKGNHKGVLLVERGHKCECCTLSTWNNIPITIELEHIDGDNRNNVKENLKLLCPNCHSQTKTWRGRQNTGKEKVSDSNLLYALQQEKNIRQALLKVGLTAKAGNYNRCYKLLRRAGLAELVDASGLSPDDSVVRVRVSHPAPLITLEI